MLALGSFCWFSFIFLFDKFQLNVVDLAILGILADHLVLVVVVVFFLRDMYLSNCLLLMLVILLDFCATFIFDSTIFLSSRNIIMFLFFTSMIFFSSLYVLHVLKNVGYFSWQFEYLVFWDYLLFCGLGLLGHTFHMLLFLKSSRSNPFFFFLIFKDFKITGMYFSVFSK